MRRLALVLVAAAAVAGAVLLAVRLLARPPSDEERIRALFDAGARAAAERRVGDAVQGVSERFRGRGLDKQGVRQLVAFHALRGEWRSVSVAGAAVTVEGESARAVVDLVLARSGTGKDLADLLPAQASAYRVDCALEMEDGEWRVVAAEWRPVALGEALAGPEPP